MTSSQTDDANLPANRVVLDASALLALALSERGAEIVQEALAVGALMSAVNLSEVLTRLIDLGGDGATSEALVMMLNPEIAGFDAEQAGAAAGLRHLTRHLGLSLGDRACLALAREMGLPVLTADRTWSQLDVGVDVRLIR